MVPPTDLRPLALAVVLGVTACASSGAPNDRGSQDLGISLPNVQGALVSPAAERGDEIFVLMFWATWCQPCQQELAKMNDLYAAKRSRGLRVYAVNIDGPDTAAQVATWVQREGYRFEVLLDRETQVLSRFNPRGDIPYYVVLDARGRILRDHQGYMTGDMKALDEFLDGVLPPA